MSYKARFIDVNDNNMRYLIVCVDKTWGQSGCQPWTGDWVQAVWLLPGQSIDSPYFTPKTVLTAVTSSDAGYYYKVEIIDQNGNVVKTCDYVDRNNPCYFYPPTQCPSGTQCMTTIDCAAKGGTCVSYNCQPGAPPGTTCCCSLQGTVKITDSYIPSIVYVNQMVSWYVVGQVTGGNVTNPGVGIYYIDGPSDYIVVIDAKGNRMNLYKGKIAHGDLTGTYPPGTTIDSRAFYKYVIFPSEGTYTVATVAGYYDSSTGMFKVTDRKDYTVTATTPPSPGTVVITYAEHPTSVTTNQEFKWRVIGTVQGGNVTNPGVGYMYENGPSDYITIVMADGSKVTLRRGDKTYKYLSGSQPPGTTINSTSWFEGAIYPTDGTYTVYLIVGYYDSETNMFIVTDQRKYTVTSSSAPPTKGTVVITSAYQPGTVYVNEEFGWYVVGQVQNGVVTNPGVGYYYIAGPASSITVVRADGTEITISPGQIAYAYLKGDQQPGTTIDSRQFFRSAKFPEEGTYTVGLVAGYYDESTGRFIITDERDYTVNCTTTPPPTKCPSGTVCMSSSDCSASGGTCVAYDCMPGAPRGQSCCCKLPPPPSPSPSPSPPPSPPAPPSPPPPTISTTDLLIAAGVLAVSALIGFGITYAVRQATKK